MSTSGFANYSYFVFGSLFFKGESYLAEQFRQITHYYAEQSSTNNTLFGGTVPPISALYYGTPYSEKLRDVQQEREVAILKQVFTK